MSPATREKSFKQSTKNRLIASSASRSLGSITAATLFFPPSASFLLTVAGGRREDVETPPPELRLVNEEEPRMPQNLWQMVGNGGWQLSQGERSRLVLARALLQEPTLLLVDESFAALDPEIFLHAFRGVTERSETLLVVAHP